MHFNTVLLTEVKFRSKGFLIKLVATLAACLQITVVPWGHQ